MLDFEALMIEWGLALDRWSRTAIAIGGGYGEIFYHLQSAGIPFESASLLIAAWQSRRLEWSATDIL